MEYMRKLGAVVCPNTNKQRLDEIEKKYQILGYGSFVVMYGLFFLGMYLMSHEVEMVGFIIFLLGIVQYYLIVSLNELWYSKHHRYAVNELNKDPEARALIAEYSKETWPVSKDTF